jgi:short-subunit dehydrogenase
MKGSTKLQIVAGMAAIITYKILKRTRREPVKDKGVFITGGSRGLGLVLARQLARKGAKVAICARDKDEIDKAVGQIRSFGGNVSAYICDVADRKSVENMVRKATVDLDGIDILINSAGIIQVGPVNSMRIEEYEDTLNINFWGAVYTTLAVLPQMRSRKSGNIVNITSIGGMVAIPHLLPYSVSKFALVGFSEGLHAELKKDKVHVTTVYPGLMRTGSHHNIDVLGDNKKEFGLFSILGTSPLVSVNSEKAARKIIKAFRDKKASYILSIPATVLAKVHGLFPGLTSEILGLINYTLPSSEKIEKVKGYESYSSISPSFLTKLGDKAAVENNEI